MSPFTLTENVNAHRSLVNLELKQKLQADIQHNLQLRAKLDSSDQFTPVPPGQPIDVNKYLKRQRDDIKAMMLQTNAIIAARKQINGAFDFFIADMKQFGRVDIKQATPYTIYTGKVRCKGNEGPVRVELMNDKMSVQISMCFDDPTFGKNTVTTVRSQTDKLAVTLPNTAEFVYLRFHYESQDLTPMPLLIFRVYFGKAQSLLASTLLSAKQESQDTGLSLLSPGDPLPVSRVHQDKAKRKQMITRVQQMINDETKAGTVLQEMFQLKADKQHVQSGGRDFKQENLERAGLWPEISAQNLGLRAYGKELETELAAERRQKNEQEYIRKRQEYQIRWDIYRKKMEELVKVKKSIMEELTRKCGYLAVMQAKEIMSILAVKLVEKRAEMIRKIMRDIFQKRIMRQFFK